MKTNRLIKAFVSLAILVSGGALAVRAEDSSAIAFDPNAPVYSVGYFGPNAMLVFKDSPKTVYFVAPGDTVKGFKIKTVHDAAVIAESGGKPFSVSFSQAPLSVPMGAMEAYLANIVSRVDKVGPGITEITSVVIGSNGVPIRDRSTINYFVRAMPFGFLPTGVENITLDARTGFQRKTAVHLTQMQLVKPAI